MEIFYWMSVVLAAMFFLVGAFEFLIKNRTLEGNTCVLMAIAITAISRMITG